MIRARHVLPIVAGVCVSVLAQAQDVSWYKFKDKYISLGTLKKADTVAQGAVVFQRATMHAAQFGVDESLRVEVQDQIWTLGKSREIVIRDKAGKTLRTIADPDIATKADNISGNLALFAVAGGVVRLVRLEGRHGYVLRRYDAQGSPQGSFRLAHTRYTTKGNVTTSDPHLYYFAHTDHEVVFSSLGQRAGETVILGLADGGERRLPYAIAGLVIGARDRRLAGWAHPDETGQKLSVEVGERKFTIEDEGRGDAVRAIIDENIIYLAHYHNIATGCRLSAYDIRTGKSVWRADVKQLNVGHSEYYNLVYLSLLAGRLVLEANEAAGAYLQIFDPKTGARLFADVPSLPQ